MQYLGLVTLVVADYDDALDHYVGDLGFTLVEDRPEDDKRWVVVAPAGTEHVEHAAHILLARASDDRQCERIGDQTGGRVAFFLYTDDFERDRVRMEAAGVEFLEAPRREPYGTVAVFRDRLGNRWDLLEPTAR